MLRRKRRDVRGAGDKAEILARMVGNEILVTITEMRGHSVVIWRKSAPGRIHK